MSKYYSEQQSKEIIDDFQRLFGNHSLMINSFSFNDFNFMSNTEKIDFKALKSRKNNDFLEEIEYIKNIIKNHDWEGYVIDFSTEKSPLKVVRIVIPCISDILNFVFKRSEKHLTHNQSLLKEE